MLPILLACIALTTEPLRIDLNDDASRQVIVDQEDGVYLGHVSTILLDDRRTILAAYPKGHGRGPIILKRSTDGGLTWSERLPTPPSWETSQETPTLYRMGERSLILFSGLYPIRAARSHDDGQTWTDLEPIGDFGGIVAMGDVYRRPDDTFAAFFHDDGRFFRAGGTASGAFTIYQTDSADAGATWSEPNAIWSGSDVHLCEPGLVRSPDGSTLAMLLRENRRARPSHIMLSTDHARTWSEPRELPAALTGDRHTARYAPDGRLVVTFRCMRTGDPWQGDWVAWVGRWEDLLPTPDPAPPPAAPTTPATYLIRLKDNLTRWDCGYPGLELMPDGMLVATTYGTWTQGAQPSILSVRFTLSQIDALAAASPPNAPAP